MSREIVLVRVEKAKAKVVSDALDGVSLAGRRFGCVDALSDLPETDAGERAAPAPSWTVLRLAPDGDEVGLGSWDLAHVLLETEEFKACYDAGGVLEVESGTLGPPVQPVDYAELAAAPGTREATGCEPEGQDDYWATNSEFAWHLGDDYTQLARARKQANYGQGVRIGHIDTGWSEHVTRPVNLATELGYNFFLGVQDTQDRFPRVPPFSFRGHGTGTLGLLAGNKVSRGSFDDYLGGAPLAQVVPIIASGSVIISGDVANWVKAMVHAASVGCDVVCMCAGTVDVSGLLLAAALQLYHHGVVVCCAAGNHWCFPTPWTLYYPAIYPHVLAACGAQADYKPYKNHFPDCYARYSSNYGPPSMMSWAMAGFSPNVPWPRIDCPNTIDLNGNGTSASTPQIAAAAALWMQQNGHKYPRTRVRVSACMRALTSTALDRNREHFGAGTLRAYDALGVAPTADELPDLSPPDRVAFLPLRSLEGYEALSPLERQMLETEALQLVGRSVEAQEAAQAFEPSRDGVARLADSILVHRHASTKLARLLLRAKARAGAR